jgi:Fe-S cluster assembly scaffold protein SufB
MKIIFDKSDSNKISLKNLVSKLEDKLDFADINFKIELLPGVKIYLVDDLIDTAGLKNISHRIEFILNENSWLEYRMSFKPGFGDSYINRNAVRPELVEGLIERGLCCVPDLILDKNLKFNFIGELSHAKVRIKSMCLGTQKIGFQTEQNHFSSKTSSCLCIKAVLQDSADLSCKNKIFVAENLNEVFARQINKNLFLDSTANVLTQPQLEVLSDNVKCRHGATVKTLDAEQLFYLGLRGLSFDESKKLLIEGFLSL